MSATVIQPGGGNDAPALRLHPISIETLRPLSVLGFDLYLQRFVGGEPTLYRQRNYPLEKEDIDRLLTADIEALFITDLGRLRYEQYLQENLDYFLENETTPLDLRCRFAHDAVKTVMRRAFQVIKVNRTVEAAMTLGQKITNLFSGRDLTPLDLYRMMRRDHRLFTRLTNVAGYCLVIAERMGFHDPKQLEEIAVGALLHDFGLRNVPAEIVEGRTALSHRENDLIRGHPQAGYVELREVSVLTQGQLMMVYQHHERLDGSGYPVQIRGDEMHWMAKLCSVADTFNSMTCPQLGRRAFDADEVVRHLKSGAGEIYDAEMIHCWTT